MGRAAVVDEIRRALTNTDSFETRLLDVRCDGETAATARIRNTARRGEKHLDSVQTLHLRVEQGVVSEVHIQVDDQSAVEEFWA